MLVVLATQDTILQMTAHLVNAEVLVLILILAMEFLLCVNRVLLTVKQISLFISPRLQPTKLMNVTQRMNVGQTSFARKMIAKTNVHRENA